jgi:hypothetical protein
VPHSFAFFAKGWDSIHPNLTWFSITLVTRHLRTTDDLFDTRESPRTTSMVAAAVQWAERIMKKIDNAFPK